MRCPRDDPRRPAIKDAIASLRSWDRRTSAESVPTAVAIFWGVELVERKGTEARDADEPVFDFLVGNLTDAERIDALTAALQKLQRDFGRWQVPWGEINRFQRLTDDIVQPFDDSKPSLPVGFAPSQWGALASVDWTKPRHTKKIYGAEGNSFVAAVEFGPTIHAKAIMSGGASGDPALAPFHRSGPDVQSGTLPRCAVQPRGCPRPRRAQLSPLSAEDGPARASMR